MKYWGCDLSSAHGPCITERQPTIQVAHLGGLLNPDCLQDMSLPLVWLSLHDLCCLPVRLVTHVPCVNCNTILSVVGFDCIFVLHDSLLQGPPCLTYVAGFTVLTGDLEYYSFLHQFWCLSLHSGQYTP